MIKDLGSKQIYFRSYDSLGLRMLDLNKVDFKPGSKKQFIPIAGGDLAQEITLK